MPYAQISSSVSIYYELEGEPHDQPLVLIAGQNAQLLAWLPAFKALLRDNRFQLVLFDNRDAGLSTQFDDHATYTLSDMANDVAALLDHLHMPSAHIVGQSMGGMIAQHVAIQHPTLVRSLCSIFSAPSPAYITSGRDVWDVREETPATTREAAVEQYIRREQMSGWAEWSDADIRAYAEQYVDRGWHPAGGERQMAAVRHSEDRTEALHALAAPTAVIHGLDDLLIESSGGIATAQAIPGAEIHTYAGMGHQMLPSLFPDYARIITRNAARAAATTAGPDDSYSVIASAAGHATRKARRDLIS